MVDKNVIQLAPRSERRVLNQRAFDDLLFGLFAAWMVKTIGYEHYIVWFSPIGEDHTLLSFQRRPHEAIRPSRKAGLFAEGFWHQPNDLNGLRGKLLYNAGFVRPGATFMNAETASLRSPEGLRCWLDRQVLANPHLYGQLWGGQKVILLRVPPPLIQFLLPPGDEVTRTLCNAFEQILCLHLMLTLNPGFCSCHINQTTPIKFNEMDIIICQPDQASYARRLWTKDSGLTLAQDVEKDRVWLLENSLGMGRSTEERAAGVGDVTGEVIGESEKRWHPKLLNLHALRQVGFQCVHLHLCSLVEMQIQNEPLDFAVENDPHISRCHLPQRYVDQVVNDTWTEDELRAACSFYVGAACDSARTTTAV